MASQIRSITDREENQVADTTRPKDPTTGAEVVLAKIQQDCQVETERYLDETVVPHGGE